MRRTIGTVTYLWIAPVVVAVLAQVAGAQPVTQAVPIYHGKLVVRGAGGPFDVDSGDATLKIQRWEFTLGPDEQCRATDDIFPDQEPVIVALGEEQFTLAAGELSPNKKGTVFSYRAPRSFRRGIKALRVAKQPNGAWSLRMSLAGINLSTLVLTDPGCFPMAVILGNDDVFSNVLVSRKSFSAKRFRVIPETCTPPGDEWPWTTGDTCRGAAP